MERAELPVQKIGDLAHPIEHGAVDNGATLALCLDQAGPSQDGQMGRHGILRHIKLTGDVPGGQAFGLMAHDEPKRLEAGALGQSGEDVDGLI